MTQQDKDIIQAKEHFGSLLEAQLERVERIKKGGTPISYQDISPIIVGTIGGDGIGPTITAQGQSVLEHVLEEEVGSGKVEFRRIEGLTIENRAKVGKTIPDDVLEKIKECHVVLKGPTITPRKGDRWPNFESANVAMRKELDLYANVRPVTVPKLGINWVLFRENTEDLYAVGSLGIKIGDVAVDFKVITTPGSERIIRAAFNYANNNGRDRVTCVTKANVVKTTDGEFLAAFYRIAKEFPKIQADDWYIDIVTAKMIDPKRQKDFQVFVLPNLYGDIATDLAAQLQGGVGTAGSANIGDRYGMFEAIHGTADRMVKEGRADYADPRSVMVAGSMLLKHIGLQEKGIMIDRALEMSAKEESLRMTGRPDGATGQQLTDYIQKNL